MGLVLQDTDGKECTNSCLQGAYYGRSPGETEKQKITTKGDSTYERGQHSNRLNLIQLRTGSQGRFLEGAESKDE